MEHKELMNEQLQSAIASLISKAIEATEKGAEFLSAEIPDVVNQLLMWHLVMNATMFIGALILAGIFITLDYKVFKYVWSKDHNEYDWEPNFYGGYLGLGSLIRIFVFIPVSISFNLTWLQIWIAPKIFLIEYAAKLVK